MTNPRLLTSFSMPKRLSWFRSRGIGSGLGLCRIFDGEPEPLGRKML
jgi:hypothetical protein